MPTSHPLGCAPVPLQNVSVTCQSCGAGAWHPQSQGSSTHPTPEALLPFPPPRLPALPAFKSSQAQRGLQTAQFISKSCYQESRREPPKMKGFLFLLFTISLLIMIQIQTGVLGNRTVTTSKKLQNGSPAFGSLAGGSILFFLTNTLIQLFHLT
uniref:CAMPATH-1 antigen n=1 Tax=Moschus moschiferus TaxID=68415 RepID=A0A8C6D113_MOSMO